MLLVHGVPYKSALGAEFVRFPLILFHIFVSIVQGTYSASARPTRHTWGGCTLIALPGVTNYTTCPHGANTVSPPPPPADMKKTHLSGACVAHGREGGAKHVGENHRRQRSKRCRRP